MGAASESPAPVLETMAERIRVNGAPAEVTLTAPAEGGGGWIRWREAEGAGREGCLSVDEDLLGVERRGRSVRVRAFVEAEARTGGVVFGCGGHVKEAGGSGGGRVMKDFMLEAPTDEAAEAWAEALQQCMNSLGRPKRLLILVNPFGGKKCAQRIFRNEVKPVLDAAGIDYVMQETEYRLHAQEIANKLDLMKYDGIVCVSGDGILGEVSNCFNIQVSAFIGISLLPPKCYRNGSKSLINEPTEVRSLAVILQEQHEKMGMYPRFGFATSWLFSCLYLGAKELACPVYLFLVFHAGHKQSLDVSSVKQGNTVFFSVLMLSWGFIADVDIESEKYRWMGSSRLDFYALLRVINLRKYHGRVYFVPAPGYESYGEPTEKIGGCNENTNINALCEGNIIPLEHHGYRGPVVCFKNSQWRCIEGPFVSVWLHNVPWASNDTMAAPEAKFSDGFVDVVLIKDCPKSALLGLLSKANDGSHVKSPYVIYLKVRAFRLEPGQRVNNPSKGGIIDSDGEVIARGRGTYRCREKGDRMAYGPPLEMTVDKGLATLFSPR
ncbi:hypothetical protein Taro_029368 [Colocasia esculenta]|uniref:DAGKc domain-containing protein n=1 Tax=Colocasia esculenta TaxID=4460 RepID=A0A843VJN5_COLES|nr:hypothetical protein [Colocasia esculenta]